MRMGFPERAEFCQRSPPLWTVALICIGIVEIVDSEIGAGISEFKEIVAGLK
jgi:hypothetical protein